jgi:CBS domain containing-hemolysin-like protein
MKFCGISDSDIEQELIFHNEGDSFLVNGNIDIDKLENKYLIKNKNEIFYIDYKTFNNLFAII